MKKSAREVVVIALALFCLPLTCARSSPHQARPAIWVTAYYPVWEQLWNLPPDQIDYTAFTDLVQFSVMPMLDGTIDQSGPNAVTPQISAAVVSRAHAAGDKVIICVGGMNSGPLLSLALAEPIRGIFIQNLMSFVTVRGYDGVDIDMEPVAGPDQANFKAFVYELRLALNKVSPQMLLTAAATPAAGDQPAMYSSIQDEFDQINVMTYDLSGTWDGWKTWYNSSLYDNGNLVLTANVPYPSASATIGRYIAAGVKPAKLGIGIAFYGDVWTGADGPAQSIDGVTTATAGYNAIMDNSYQDSYYHWDTVAHAPYLSIPATATTKKQFISYDDEQLCTEKVHYARQHHLGGVMIFEIGDGYRRSQPAGRRDSLLQAVSHATRDRLPGS